MNKLLFLCRKLAEYKVLRKQISCAWQSRSMVAQNRETLRSTEFVAGGDELFEKV